MTLDNQAELIKKTLAGDRVAAERIADGCRSFVRSVAYQALGNFDDACDVAQETLMYAVMKLPTLREPERFDSWLRQLTLTHCTDYRRNRRTRLLGRPIDILTETAEETDFARRQAVRDAVGGLKENLQTALLMHYIGGWSLEEISNLTGVPVNTVRSRLMTAKRVLKADLGTLIPTYKPMIATHKLNPQQLSLIEAAFPGSKIASTQFNPEPWQPFSPRVELQLRSGEQRTLDFRDNLNADRIRLAGVLETLGIPGPQIVRGPIDNGSLSLCEGPRGENLTLWALGGTPHRIHLASEKAMEGLDRLQGCTEALLNDPVGPSLKRRTLNDELQTLTDDEKWQADQWLSEEGKARHEWLADPWFSNAVARVKAAVADISTPLVYTDYGFFFPQGYRIQPTSPVLSEHLGWPNDPVHTENPIVEFVNIFGHFGDPLLGLAMVWVYDCYPFVHTGFVEQVLWRRGISRREFAPRLALKALQMIARDLPYDRPAEGYRFWDSLHGWAHQALDWI